MAKKSQNPIEMSLRHIRELSISSFLAVLHYLIVIPLFSARTAWISKETGVDENAISRESCDIGLNIMEAARTLRLTVVTKGILFAR